MQENGKKRKNWRTPSSGIIFIQENCATLIVNTLQSFLLETCIQFLDFRLKNLKPQCTKLNLTVLSMIKQGPKFRSGKLTEPGHFILNTKLVGFIKTDGQVPSM